MKSKFLLCLIFLTFSIHSQSLYEINGYVKYMFGSFSSPYYEDNLNDHLLHLRINSKFYPAKNLTVAAELRNRFLYGESVEKIPDYFDNYIKNKYEYASLDFVLWQNEKSIGYCEVDRLWIDYNAGNFQATLGRQRIAWGTSWVWNPTDIFNPLSVLDFDYEERPAVDAARVQYYLGPVSKIEIAYEPSKTNNYTAAALLTYNAFDYDFNILGGVRESRWIAGGGWSGDIYDAGFRGEILISQKISDIYPAFPFINTLPTIESGKTVVSSVLSADYTFQNSFYIHTEVLYNNIGVTKYTALSQSQALKYGLLTAARFSVYQEFSYDISPLVRGSIFGIFNPDDKSLVIVPSVSYSVITNLDLFFIAMITDGDPLTEYGGYGESYFIRLKWSY